MSSPQYGAALPYRRARFYSKTVSQASVARNLSK